jgi:hypothetical protein
MTAKSFHTNQLRPLNRRRFAAVRAGFVPSSPHLVAPSLRSIPESENARGVNCSTDTDRSRTRKRTLRSDPRRSRALLADLGRVTLAHSVTWSAGSAAPQRLRQPGQPTSFRTRSVTDSLHSAASELREVAAP